MAPHHSRSAVRFLASGMFLSALLGCGVTVPPDEPAVPHTVEWKGVAEVVLREWTELLGSVQPLPENIVRVSARSRGRSYRCR